MGAIGVQHGGNNAVAVIDGLNPLIELVITVCAVINVNGRIRVFDWSKSARRRAQNGHQSAKKTVTCSVVSGVTIAIFRQRPFVHN